MEAPKGNSAQLFKSQLLPTNSQVTCVLLSLLPGHSSSRIVSVTHLMRIICPSAQFELREERSAVMRGV